MITIYHYNDRSCTVLSWAMALRHMPANGIVEIGYDAAIGPYVIIEKE